MSEAISIAKATDAHLDSIRALLVQLMEAVEDSMGMDIDRAMQNCRAQVHDPARHLLVAKAGDCVVGFISFSVRQTILHRQPSGLMDELIVAEKYRGEGIGRRLISAAIEKCRELGCGEVEVSTEKSNTRARTLYKKCGFEEDAVLLEFHLRD